MEEGSKLSRNSIGFGNQLCRRMVQATDLCARCVATWRPVILVNFVEIEVKVVPADRKRDMKLAKLKSDWFA